METESSNNQIFGQCRCCLDVGYHKEDFRQIYRETILESFNLSLSTNPSATYMICEPCIGRLNDATEFKAMIAESERQLLTNTEITPGPEFVNVAQVDDSGVQEEHKQVNCDLIMKVEEDEWDASDGWRDMITQAVVNKPNVDNDADVELTAPAPAETREQVAQGDTASPRAAEPPDTTCLPNDTNNTSTSAKCPNADKDTNNITRNGDHNNCPVNKDKDHSVVQLTNVYPCTRCRFITNNERELQYHLKAHSTTPHYTCDVCSYITTKKVLMIRHMPSHKKPLVCKICKKFQKTRKVMKIHMRTHTGEKPYACNICDKKFAHRCNFNEHIKKHQGEKHSCNVCGKEVIGKRSLHNHMRNHDDTRNEKRFPCKICNRKFSTNFNLLRHVRVHTGDKPYACEMCDKKFIQSHHLANHAKRCWEKSNLF